MNFLNAFQLSLQSNYILHAPTLTKWGKLTQGPCAILPLSKIFITLPLRLFTLQRFFVEITKQLSVIAIGMCNTSLSINNGPAMPTWKYINNHLHFHSMHKENYHNYNSCMEADSTLKLLSLLKKILYTS